MPLHLAVGGRRVGVQHSPPQRSALSVVRRAQHRARLAGVGHHGRLHRGHDALLLCVVLCQSQPLRRGSCDRACHPVSRRQVAARCLTPLLVFLLLGFAMGLTFYLGTDYPCFLWIYDDATECGWKAGFNASVRSVG